MTRDSFFPEEHFQAGLDRFERREIESALACFSRAWELGLDFEYGAQERWMAYMLLGRFEEAWLESDRVLRNRKRDGVDCSREPLHLRFVWDGSPFDARRVLVRCYHGLGDTIQFIRYVPLLKRVASRVIVQAPAETIALLRTMSEIDELIPLEDESAEYDVDVESMELPHAFRTTLATIPANVPYLFPPAGRRLAGDFRVGIVWTAGAWRPERSIPLHEIRALEGVPGVTLYSLQRGPARAELPAAIRDISSDDILEAASAIQQLDLVVTVDTMIPHLAGALGKPVWTLLHFHSDWRWMLEGERSPWYPTMRLFRQTAPGDWRGVVDEVAAKLATEPRP